MTLLLTEKDVSKLVNFDEIISAVESGFRQLGNGKAETKPRREVRIHGKELPHADPRMVRIAQGLAYSDELNRGILHHILNFPNNSKTMRVINHLIDGSTGKVLSIVESKDLLRLRTGAAGAVGAKYLSRKNSKIAGIIGAGRQGRTQLQFLLRVRAIEEAYVFDKVKGYRESYAREMSSKLGINVTSVENVESLVENSDIVVTATPSMEPYVKASWLNNGIFVNIIGADDPPKIELDGNALKTADKVVIMSNDSFLAGQLKIPIEEGIISKKDIYGTLGEIVAGKKLARENDDEIIIYHNPGMTLQDLSVVNLAYEKAMEMGIGLEIPDPLMY